MELPREDELASIEISVDDLTSTDTHALIGEHAALMLSQTRPDSCHFLDLDGLRQPDVTLWRMTVDGELAAIGGLKTLTATDGEVKSMHTCAAFRGRGLGEAMLRHILEAAAERGLDRLWLETGSHPPYAPSRRLYLRHGFVPCPPFGNYVEDPSSAFFRLDLPKRGEQR